MLIHILLHERKKYGLPQQSINKTEMENKSHLKKIKIQENIEEIKEIHPFYNCA